MNNKTWDQEVKEINAQFRYERLMVIGRDLYKLLFDYQNPGYKWTSNEYNLMFVQLNKLCKEYDGKDWRDSDLLTTDHKIKPVIEKANAEWLTVQGFNK
tara:strand:- start:14902 stop:15198 length:297 start_codon:yes stop_codon:yes gene_type:complete